MIATLFLSLGLAAAAPLEDVKPAVDELAAYDAARAKVGRDAGEHVKLALWCESHGLTAERVKHLALAVLTDPTNAKARGLMGLVDFGGKWQRPDAVSEKVKADEKLSARLAEYNARRERMENRVEGHWKLAVWCEEVGLKPEARAHFDTVTRLDPTRDAAWKRLGFKKMGKRWVTDEQVLAEKTEREAQRAADHAWKPLLTKWRAWLHEKGKKDKAEEGLAGLDDPRAVASVWAVFAEGDGAHQARAVQLLGQIDAPGASRALALMAVQGGTSEVRKAATETLRRRDPRDFVDFLISMIGTQLKYQVRAVNGPNAPGELFVEGAKYNLRRVYGPMASQLPPVPSRIFDSSVPFNPYSDQNIALANQPRTNSGAMPGAARPGRTPNPDGQTTTAPNLSVAGAERDIQIAQAITQIGQVTAISQTQLENDVAYVEATNRAMRESNGAILPVLDAVTGKDLGESSEEWKAWWTDQKGYAYQSSTTQDKPTFATLIQSDAPLYVPPQPPHGACFAAGTPVRTIEGPRSIESIKVGDQVLSQNTRTGRLSFTPILAVFHNSPASTLKVKVGEETIVATGIHRFWKAGRGWVMARDLKPGDSLRSIDGTDRVESVETDIVRPVFNLEVADGQSFFVGERGMLVHDNSLVQPETRPFDGAEEVARSEK